MRVKVGDRVEHELYGKGTVIGFSRLSTPLPLVEFDNPGLALHDGNGIEKNGTRGKDGHCLYTSDIKSLNSQTVVIYPKGLETIALLKEGKKIIKQTSAKCNPTDVYDFEVGAKLAFSRLMGEEVAIIAIREVKRPAKVGEWVKVVNASNDPANEYKNGDILQVVKSDFAQFGGWAYYKNQIYKYLSCGEYVVLENYQPESLADYTDKELITELAKRWEDRQ